MTCLPLRGNFEPFSKKQPHCKQNFNGSELLFMQWEPSLNQTRLEVSLFLKLPVLGIPSQIYAFMLCRAIMSIDTHKMTVSNMDSSTWLNFPHYIEKLSAS